MRKEEDMNYFNQDPSQVMSELRTTPEGLSSTEVKGRIEESGYNELKEGKKKSTLEMFIDQFKDFLIIMLKTKPTTRFLNCISKPTIK